MLRKFIVTALGVALFAGSAAAGQVVVSVSESVRIVNPEDSGDVRMLYKFALPEVLTTSDIVLAVLRIPTEGQEEAPVAVGLIESTWSDRDTWTSLAGTLGDSPAYSGRLDQGVLASNHLEPNGEESTDLGIEVTVTEMVVGWTSGSENYGICARSVSGRDDDLGSVFPADMAEPELLILYTSK